MPTDYLQHKLSSFTFKLSQRGKWDFRLTAHNQSSLGSYEGDDSSDCNQLVVDFNNPKCHWMGEFRSLPKDGIDETEYVMDNIGLTGLDNGLLQFDKYTISNKEFLNLYQNSRYTLKNDGRLTLHPVIGNHGKYRYGVDIIPVDGDDCCRFDGGFLQGIWRSPDGGYSLLPDEIPVGDTWAITADISLAPSEDRRGGLMSINEVYPENAGIFFFMGLRAENKWAVNAFDDDNTIQGYLSDDSQHCDYLEVGDASDETYTKGGYLTQGSIADSYDGHYVTDDYLESVEPIDSDMAIADQGGSDVRDWDRRTIISDNKYLLFDNGKDGLQASDTNGDDARAEIVYHSQPSAINGFIEYHHGKDGLCADNRPKHAPDYDIDGDIYRNAFALRITPSGAVGYRYAVKDCESKGATVLEEYSKDGIVEIGEWHRVETKIQRKTLDAMQIRIYVDGKLKLSSREIPVFNFRKLQCTDSAQAGVPYNISIGGGTLGLAEAVYPDFMRAPERSFFLEKHFGGTFEGLIRRLEIVACQ